MLLLALLAAADTLPADRPVAFVNVTVVTMDRPATLADQTVVVRDGRVAALGPAGRTAMPDGAVRIEGRGRWLIPGLAEMHAHIPPGQATREEIERVLFLYLANGITTVRGMLGAPQHLAIRDAAARGEIWSPRIVTSGPSVNGTSAPTPEAVARMVAEQHAAGYDFLKIHPGLSRATFDAMVAIADRLGMRFAGHVPADVGLDRALEARYATIDHLDGFAEWLLADDAPARGQPAFFFGVNYGGQLDLARIPEAVRRTRAAGTWMVPTQVLMENLAGTEAPEALAARPEMRFASASAKAQWTQQTNGFRSAPGVTAAGRADWLAMRQRLLKALHDGGVGILLGSDAPQVWNVSGFSVHRELQLYVQAGLSPREALATATVNVARFLGREAEGGTIAVGKRADLVLLRGDPLADIRRTAAIEGVMIGGRWLDRVALDARLEAIAAAMR